MSAPIYTKTDMKKLAEMSKEHSPAKIFLEEVNYDPKKFKDILEEYSLNRDILYLYETPIEEIPLLINKGEISGYLKFRLTVGK